MLGGRHGGALKTNTTYYCLCYTMSNSVPKQIFTCL